MQGLCTYLPSTILDYLYMHSEKLDNKEPPFRQDYETVVLFADVSGFTKLSEKFANRGSRGHELLKKHLNSYFEVLMRESTSQGGDVFKFAGDAILVVWPRSNEELGRVTRRAVQCAVQIKEQLTGYKILDPDRPASEKKDKMELNVKLGIGVGKISILHIGGFFGRMEYVATGQPLTQSFEAEGRSKKGDETTLVVASPEVWKKVSNHFDAYKILDEGYAYIKGPKRGMTLPKVSVFKTTTSLKYIGNEPEGSKIMKRVTQYVPGAVRPYVKDFEESWADELRVITVLFVNLGLVKGANELYEKDSDLKKIHDIIMAVQKAVYKYEGSLNKFLMDDKGSTLIAVFGLPPLAHENDPERGLLSSIQICTQLHQRNLVPSIGVTTGTAFCGVIGTRNRREYSILGDTVNLAARLMSHAEKKIGGGVLCDEATHYASKKRLKFTKLREIMVKGKSKPIKIYHPYPKSYIQQFTKDRKDETPRVSLRRRSIVSYLDAATSMKSPTELNTESPPPPHMREMVRTRRESAPSAPATPRGHRRSWLFWRRGMKPNAQKALLPSLSGSTEINNFEKSLVSVKSAGHKASRGSRHAKLKKERRGSALFRRNSKNKKPQPRGASLSFTKGFVDNINSFQTREREVSAETAAISAVQQLNTNSQSNIAHVGCDSPRSLRRGDRKKNLLYQDSDHAYSNSNSVFSSPAQLLSQPPPPPPPPPADVAMARRREPFSNPRSAPASRRHSHSHNIQDSTSHIPAIDTDTDGEEYDSPNHPVPPPPIIVGGAQAARGIMRRVPRRARNASISKTSERSASVAHQSVSPSGREAIVGRDGNDVSEIDGSSVTEKLSVDSHHLSTMMWSKERRAKRGMVSFGGGEEALSVFEPPIKTKSYRDVGENILTPADKAGLQKLLKGIDQDQSLMTKAIDHQYDNLSLRDALTDNELRTSETKHSPKHKHVSASVDLNDHHVPSTFGQTRGENSNPLTDSPRASISDEYDMTGSLKVALNETLKRTSSNSALRNRQSFKASSRSPSPKVSPKTKQRKFNDASSIHSTHGNGQAAKGSHKNFVDAVGTFLSNPNTDTNNSMMVASATSFSLSGSCKVIRVQLPKSFGFQTVDCGKLETVGQITKKVFEIRKKRGLILPGKSWQDFELCFPKASKALSDGTKIMKLQTLRSLHFQEQKKVRNMLRHRSSIEMKQSPMNALSLLEGDDTIASGFPSDNLMELSLRRRGTVAPRDFNHMRRASSGVDVEKTMVEGKQMSKLRKILLSKIGFLMSGELPIGGQVIISGGMGLGKTKLLDSTMQAAQGGHGVARICYAKGSQFDMRKPLAAVRDIFVKLIDLELNKHYAHYNGTLRENRRNLIVNLLRLKDKTLLSSRNGVPLLSDVIPVLNAPLRMEFAETRYTHAMSTEERSETAVRLMIYLLEMLTKERPAVIMLDDAIFLDRTSWKLLLKIAKKLPKILLIIATRPLNRSYMAAFAKDIPEEFKTLIRLPSTLYVPLRPRAPGVLYKIACASLGVADLPPVLADFVLAKANGNPKVVKEFCYELCSELKIFTVQDGWVHLKKDIDWDKLSADLRCPFSVRALIARRLDRLSYKAQMLLKIAALIGHRFSFRTISKTYPLREKKSLQKEFKTLQDFRIIELAKPPLLGNVPEDEVEWQFVETFMKAMLRNRLISNQTKQLRVRVLNVRVQHFVECLGQMRKKNGSHVAKAHRELSLWDNINDCWKKRYLVASYKGLFVLENSKSWEVAGSQKSHIRKWLRLNTALVRDPVKFKGKKYVVELQDVTDYYDRAQKDFFDVPRSFHISFPDEVTMNEWFLIFKQVNSQKYSKLLKEKKSLEDRQRLWEKIVKERKEKLVMPHPKMEKTRFEVLFTSVLSSLTQRRRASPRAEKCKVKKFSKGFGLTSYKKRFIMLASSTDKARYDKLNNSHRGTSPGGLPLQRSNVGILNVDHESDDDADEEGIDVLVISKTDGRKEVILTDAVCLTTRKCKVVLETPFNPEQEKKLDSTGEWSLLVTGQLWLKRGSVTWEEKTMKVMFESSEDMYFWHSKIHEAIHIRRKKPDITESALANFYDDEDEENDVRPSWDIRAVDDDVNSLLRSPVHKSNVISGPDSTQIPENSPGMATPDASRASLPVLEEKKWRVANPQDGNKPKIKEEYSLTRKQSIHSEDSAVNLQSSRTTVVLNSIPLRSNGLPTSIDVHECDALAPARSVPPGRRLRRASPKHKPSNLLTRSNDSLSELNTASSAAVSPKSPSNESASDVSFFEELDSAKTVARQHIADTEKIAKALVTLENVLQDPKNDRKSIEDCVASIRKLVEQSAATATENAKRSKANDTLSLIGPHVDRKTSQWIKQMYSRRHPTKPHKMIWSPSTNSSMVGMNSPGPSGTTRTSLSMLTLSASTPAAKDNSAKLVNNFGSTPETNSVAVERGTPSALSSMQILDKVEEETSSTVGKLKQSRRTLDVAMDEAWRMTETKDSKELEVTANMFHLVDALVPIPPERIGVPLLHWPVASSSATEGLDKLESWGWSVWGRSDDELFRAIVVMYERCGLFRDFDMETLTFTRFVSEIRDRYLDAPYHNFRHAVDVTQTVYCLMKSMDLDDCLMPIERLALLTAALCHDVQHPGLNNAYLVAAHAPLAVLYNDNSVLENFHAAVTFSVLARPETNIFGNLSRKQYQTVRQAMVDMILATDMTCHFGMVESFNSILDRKGSQNLPNGPKAKAAIQSRRRTLLNMVLHTCDISNPCKPWPLCVEWSNRITQEFFAQGDRAREEGLPVSANMDRSQANQSEISLNFIDFIVGPQFVALKRLLPRSQECLDFLEENRTKWFEKFTKGSKPTTTHLTSDSAFKKKWKIRNDAFGKVLSGAKAQAKEKKNPTPFILSVFPHNLRSAANSPVRRKPKKTLTAEKVDGKNPKGESKEGESKQAGLVLVA